MCIRDSGSAVNFSGQLYNSISYHVDKETGRVNFDEVKSLAQEHKPKMIICGGGASGLILASRVCNDNYFINKSILLIEKDIKNTNDRTWCFWEEGKGEYDDIISHSWQNGKFQAKNFELNFSFINKLIINKKTIAGKT